MREKIKELYYREDLRFPIIGAVLEGNVEGNVFCNDETNPTHIFVISKFGFCQEIYTQHDSLFFEKIKQVIETRERVKLRMYNPGREMRTFLETKAYAKEAKRKRYLPGDSKVSGTETGTAYVIRKMRAEDVEKEDFGLCLSSRYYRDTGDFIRHAMPLVACDKTGSEYIGMIYSAGNDKTMSEIDIFIKEKYRRKGMAFYLTAAFTKQCRNHSMTPVWDCYSNLESSYRLAEKSGFVLKQEYVFYNIEAESK